MIDLSGDTPSLHFSEEGSDFDDHGWFDERWDGREASGRILPSGVYFVELTAPTGRLRQKLLLLK